MVSDIVLTVMILILGIVICDTTSCFEAGTDTDATARVHVLHGSDLALQCAPCIAASQGYLNGSVVPYRRSQSMLKDAISPQRYCSGSLA